MRLKGVVHHEIERRFAPGKIPAAIVSGIAKGMFRKVLILQGYLAKENGAWRLRHEVENGRSRFFQTRKEGEGVDRVEYEERISQEKFVELFSGVTGSLRKIRYFIPLERNHDEDCMLELNVFVGYSSGEIARYVQIEVEFSSREEAEAFDPPGWFDKDVTDDAKHGNHYIAHNGAPEE